MDSASVNRLSKIHPLLAAKITQLIINLAALGLDVRVVQGIRTFAEQNDLYAKGRTKPGNRVTNAVGGQSNHNYGLAVDLCPFVAGKADWENLALFRIIGREAKKLGLEWGGDWKFVDMPHVQLPGMSVKECQLAYKQGGINRVWERMHAIIGGAKPTTFIPAANNLIEFGDKGAAVTELQQKLAALSLMHAHEIDGDFGKITKRAVIGFQRQNGLTADGIVGEGTKAKLQQAVERKNHFADLRDEEIKINSPKVSAAAPATPIPPVSGNEANSSNQPLNEPPPDAQASETKKQETTLEETPTGTKQTTVDETTFKSETKEMAPPEKEGSTKTVVATTAGGWTLAAAPMLIWAFIKSSYEQGQIDVKAVFDLVVKFYSENTRYIFYSIIAIMLFLAMKKAFKQLSFIVQMIINAIPWLHDIKLVPKDKV